MDLKLLVVQIRMMEAERFSKGFRLDGWDIKSHGHIENALIGTLHRVDNSNVTRLLKQLKHLLRGNYIQIGYCYDGKLPKDELIHFCDFQEQSGGYLKKVMSDYVVLALPVDAGGYWTLNITNLERIKGLQDDTLDPSLFLQQVLTFDTGMQEVAV